MIQIALRFILEVLNLVRLNRSKDFLAYKSVANLMIQDAETKGVFSLLCLVQCDSELIKYDAVDILVSLAGMEGAFREKLSKLANIT